MNIEFGLEETYSEAAGKAGAMPTRPKKETINHSEKESDLEKTEKWYGEKGFLRIPRLDSCIGSGMSDYRTFVNHTRSWKIEKREE